MLRCLIISGIIIFVHFSVDAKTAIAKNLYHAMQTDTLKETPEQLVQRQLEAYNSRDLKAFLATYSEDIILNDLPEKLICSGMEALRNKYKIMFENTPDLFCEIKKRIVLGNKVIDHEYVLKNGKYISVVAVYEINNALITKVTFIRE